MASVLVSDRKYRSLRRRVVGLLQIRRKIEARLSGCVERDISGEILGTQSELAIYQGAGGLRGAIDQTSYGQATRDEEQRGELERQPELE